MNEPSAKWRPDAPARAALRWAEAAGLAWTKSGERPHVGSRELLVGILLADLHESPARVFLHHFGIPVGALLSPMPRPLDPAELLTLVDRVPENPPVADALKDATATLAGPGKLISVRELFGALLRASDEFGVRLAQLLAARGVDLWEVITAYREHLASRIPLAELLRERFPGAGARVRLPAYLPDQPRRDTADLVGVTEEINAFANLIASRQLVPPLAIGLFGDWGSGKSYFLRGLRDRVGTIARDAAEDTFLRHVVQVEFNAWQYVGGDLWASLLEHLFRNLRRSGDDSDDLLGQRQQFWVGKIRDAETEHGMAVEDRAALKKELEAAQRTVALKEQEQRDALAGLARAREKNPFAAWKPSAELREKISEAAAKAGIDVVGERAEELAAELGNARKALGAAGTVLAPLRTGGWRYAGAVGALLVLPVIVGFAVRHADALAGVAATISSVLASVIGYLKLGTGAVTSATSKIAQAQTELAQAEAEQRERFEQEIKEAETTLTEAQSALDSATCQEQELASKVVGLKAELAAMTPRRVLSDFITDRLASEDYRSHLGVPALVRRDLERLSRLVAAHRDNPAGEPVPEDYAIDRIVLYIDDLDRCPPELVVKVLEAVHLLLAFPLFVVVVAVDSRWLTSSLEKHYAQLGGDGASPDAYLEKIFQVPFWVRPLGAGTRQDMLRALLAPSLAAEPRVSDAEPEQGAELQPADFAVFAQRVASLSGARRDETSGLTATGLTLTARELKGVEDAAGLLGDTPRAIKRFVNTYLLVKSMSVARGWSIPDDRQLAVLIALVTWHPGVVEDLLSRITPEDGTLGKALADRPIPVLERWIAEKPDRAELDLAPFRDWIELVARFRFSR
ncbi:KAP family P-loop domain-containing protein [Amycolatopsis xylanica]|uniref:KAP family P-loop domain-containing protein n=1 Tax=Amycolatopsis xylanica TaxID=589385 RepID=A0A1H2UQ75_9PSEU|nr:P-loop NTPase fold protein [Amycolatopsis xylanica]SDW57729.1 KAP family P-loop domain-containing protein [Amycolatopsis xylanica]